MAKPTAQVSINLLDRTAGDLVEALIAAGETYQTIIDATGLEKSDISRWRNNLRQASESKWRTLAKYAVTKLKL